MQPLEKNLRKLNETMPRVVDDGRAPPFATAHGTTKDRQRKREKDKNIYVTEIRCIGRGEARRSIPSFSDAKARKRR